MPIEVVRSLAPEAWDQYVDRNPSANIFHTRQFIDCFATTPKYVPHTFFLQEDGRTIASVIAVQTRIVSALPRLASRMVVFGGLSFAGDIPARLVNKQVGALLQAYDDSVRNQTLFTEIRNMEDHTAHILPITRAGYRFVPHLNYLVDLSQGEERLSASFSSDHRRTIKRPEKAGVTVAEMTSPEGLGVFHELVSKVYAAAHVPVLPITVFEEAWKRLHPLGQLRIIFAEREGTVIAARATLLYHGRVFDWFAGSNDEGDKTNANALLVWNTMQFGINHGYTVFDFGGAGDPNVHYGVREFKGRFQGELVNYGRFVKIYSRPRYLLGYQTYSALRRVLF
jgi:lipid II:glycine glycyltransferase (peptidoglycan interpeptide bridge formation enzyme)